MSKKVLFWNLNGRGNQFMSKLANVSGGVDILLLAESEISDDEIADKLNLRRVPLKLEFDESELTPKLYSNISELSLQHYSSSPSKRLCFFLLTTVEHGEIILACIHFPSKASYRVETQVSFANNYAQWISDVERFRKHKRTIVLGDFNMNPFEPGMIEPQAFNATLSYEIAKQGRRTSHYKKFDYFYNPMWNWLGDREHHSGSPKLPGSFYYKTTADVTQIYWNVFDKVIVRPEIIDLIDYASLKIVEAIGREELITQDCENKEESFTDHLPLKFNLNISTP